MGITFSTHFCMDRAVDSELMIGMHELSCGMMDMESTCETEETRFMSLSCCDNEFISVEIEDDYEVVNEEFSIESSFLFSFAYTFLFWSIK